MGNADGGQRAIWKLVFPVEAVDGATSAFFVESLDDFIGVEIVELRNVGDGEMFFFVIHDK